MENKKEQGVQYYMKMMENLDYNILTDEKWFVFVLEQIVSNAVKYTKEGSMGLTVGGQRDGEDIILSFVVEDTGIGIKEEDMDKLSGLLGKVTKFIK